MLTHEQTKYYFTTVERGVNWQLRFRPRRQDARPPNLSPCGQRRSSLCHALCHAPGQPCPAGTDSGSGSPGFRARHDACLRPNTMSPLRLYASMRAPVCSARVLLAFIAGAAFIAGCSSSDTTSSAGGSAGDGVAGNASSGAGGNTSGGSVGQSTGGGGSTAGGANAGSSAGGSAGSSAGGSAGACSPSLPVCPAKGTNAADNCQMGAICCNGSDPLTCFCAAETCTFYFGI